MVSDRIARRTTRGRKSIGNLQQRPCRRRTCPLCRMRRRRPLRGRRRGVGGRRICGLQLSAPSPAIWRSVVVTPSLRFRVRDLWWSVCRCDPVILSMFKYVRTLSVGGSFWNSSVTNLLHHSVLSSWCLSRKGQATKNNVRRQTELTLHQQSRCR